jgi:iron complex outermembrane receptor protein
MDYRDGSGRIIPNGRFNNNSMKLNAGLNKKLGSFQLFYDYNAMNLGMTTPDALELVTDNSRRNEFWYQDLDNHLVLSRNKIFIGRYKVGANVAYQKSLRKENTDERNEVDMGMNVISWDVKTWLPSSENTEYILGLQGAVMNNSNYEGHVRILPDYSQEDLALLGWMKHTHANNLSVQVGMRWEYRSLFAPEQEKASHSHDEPGQPEEEEPMEQLDRFYQNISFSAGGTWQINNDLLWRFNVASAYRTPNMAELSQDGAHGPRYEEGNRDLQSQRSYEGDMSLHYHTGIMEVDLAGFYNRLNDYIYLAPTGEFDDELPVYRYTQSNARIYGMEAFLSIYPVEWMKINTVYEYLRGMQQNGDHLPFIPQDKIKLDLRFERAKLGKLLQPYFSIGTDYAFNQNRPAQFETNTDGYVLFDAGAGFNIRIQNQKLSISVIAMNLLDETYYDHLSTLKEMNLYNMGRNITFSVRVPFGLKGVSEQEL